MSSLRKLVSENASEIRDGICNVIFYKNGRSWESCEIWSDLMNADSCSEWDPEDVAEMARIAEIDPNAVAINGYYDGHLGEKMTVAELEQGVRWHYEMGSTFVRDCVADYYAQNQPQEAPDGQQNSSAENAEPTTTADKAYFEGATSLQAHTSGNIPNLFKIKEPRLVRCHGPPDENRLDL